MSKKRKLPGPVSPEAGAQGEDKVAAKKVAEVVSPALGLTERRRTIRKLPVPEVKESDRESDWAAFSEIRDTNKSR